MYHWILFVAFVFVLLAFDLGVFHKKERVISLKKSLWISSFYVLMALIFGAWIFYLKGPDALAQYVTGFLVEKSLALDNIFVISVIFSFLSIPPQHQHRVLFLGILGAIILRAIMIGLSVELVSRFEWILYIFGAFMIVMGIRMLFAPHHDVEFSKNPFLIWLEKHLNITKKLHGQKFWICKNDTDLKKKKLFITPLFVALIMVEFMDIVFAIDSIPAIFAITKDPYIIYTSNVFAILGLRSLYFALSAILERFYYLKHALAIILIFIGSKIFIADALNYEKISSTVCLAITLGVLLGGIFLSYFKKTTIDRAQ